MNQRDAIAAEIASRYSLPSTNMQENIQHFLRSGVPMSNIMRHPAYAEMSALDQGGGGFAGGDFTGGGGGAADTEPYQYPTDPSDPADYSSGFTQQGSALLGDMAPEGFSASVAQQGFATPGHEDAAPGTGLGLAVTGYNSDLGLTHAANMADQAMTSSAVMDAIDTSHAVNTAVEEGGYTSPSPAPDPGYTSPDPSSTIVGLPSDFTTSQASLSDMTGTTGADMGGSAIAADVAGALSGLNAGVNDAAAGYDSSGGFSGDSGSGGSGGGGSGK